MSKVNRGLYDGQYEHDACGLGVIANLDGSRTHHIVQQGLQILCNLEHRGAVGGDEASGDGSGIMVQLPDAMLREELSCKLPPEGEYGLLQLFLSREEEAQETLRRICGRAVAREHGQLLAWRDLIVYPEHIGELARTTMPHFCQLVVRFAKLRGDALERKLYLLRRIIERKALAKGYGPDAFYIASASSRTVVYKGMLKAPQLSLFYQDLQDPRLVSSLAMVHERYSTNTLPSWPLAQPFRYLAHNGEINTLRSNVNFMHARESSLKSEKWGDEFSQLLPIVQDNGSDTACLDNAFELLHLSGRSVEHTLMMLIPEAFGSRFHIAVDRKMFYEYHSAIMEPWDGPAAVVVTDGRRIAATLDRNGLRPARYCLSRQGQFVLASEAGVQPFSDEDIIEKGRLSPGKLLVADLEEGRMIYDNEAKNLVVRRQPYRRWLQENCITLPNLFAPPISPPRPSKSLKWQMRRFGYHYEDLHRILKPMVLNGQEPLGSMGNDVPLAVLSDRPVLLYDYFHQQFAQVTNPPIDPYRESIVMSLMSYVGREINMLEEGPEHCRQLRLEHPVLTNQDVRTLLANELPQFKVQKFSLLYTDNGLDGRLPRAIDELCRQVEEGLDQGVSFILLSDRDLDKEWLAIPALLAVSAVHHHLVRAGKRHLAALGVETGEAREVHHFATLVASGASAVNPYLAFETIADLQEQGHLPQGKSLTFYVGRYIEAIKKGLLKTMSKMGISTLRSYRGSQIYEAVGLAADFMATYFPGTSSRIGGIGIREVEADVRARGQDEGEVGSEDQLLTGGKIHLAEGQERHHLSAQAIPLLHQAVRSGDFDTFRRYSALINQANEHGNTLRSLFRFKKAAKPLNMAKVEPAAEIVKRFVVSAMSFGSLSPEAHQSIAIAMNRLGASSNCGEGGEDPLRYRPLPNGDSSCSKVKQIASGRFGVDSQYLHSAQELQIKMAQGAKPGEGGQLPGFKVDETIARIRYTTPGVGLVSPPPHHDVYSIEDLAQLIYDLKSANPKARVSVKLVATGGVGTIAAGVVKGKADMVLIAGFDGGTGASPLSSIKYAGYSWELGLAETQQTLVYNQLRRQVRVQCDGQMKTGRDVVVAALLGAEEFGFGTSALLSLGCVMMRKCHTNSCPVGIATQDPRCRQRFQGKPEHLQNFMLFVAEEVRLLMSQLGMATFDEMVGAVEKLDFQPALSHYKAKGLDLSPILTVPTSPYGDESRRCTVGQTLNRRYSIDEQLVEESAPALERAEAVTIEREIRNCNRSVGATLSYHVTDRYGAEGLPDGTISLNFRGSAGQSFGAFLTRGITATLEGESNDYLGKGLSGGRIVLHPSAKFQPLQEEQVITGNVALFGATGGEAYIAGMAGERFCVRNSGAITVVEGVGDHGCEYMTGGRVVILGQVGVNFAAGMSGGIAYVLDPDQLLDTRCNLDTINVELLDDDDEVLVQQLLARHVSFTASPRATRLLQRWEADKRQFVKVMPIEYKSALARMAERDKQPRLLKTA